MTVNLKSELIAPRSVLSHVELDENFKELRSLTGGRISVTGPDYAAVGDGIADDYAAIQAAVTAQQPIFMPPGTYYLSATVRPPINGFIDITAIPGTVTIKCAKDIAAFGKPAGADSAAGNLRLVGLIFDGEHARGTTWPYSNATSNYKMPYAFQIPANSNTADTECIIRSCVFRDFMTFPLQVFHYKRVECTKNKFTRCKDPGFLFCQHVVFSENVVEWSSDNGVSISRGCKNIICNNNVIRDSQIAGIWVAGFTPSANVANTLTITGTYTFGGAVTVTASSSTQWNMQYLNTYVLAVKGSDSVVIKITAISSFTVATGVAVSAVPASLQNAATDSWTHSPATGPAAFTAVGNTIVGSDAGIRATTAARHGVITGNTVLRSGYCADSEVYSTGTISTGTNSLVVADGSVFAQNDWVIIDPVNSLDDYFVAKISSKSTNTLTLDRNAPVTYVSEVVRRCHQLTGHGFGVWIEGDHDGVHQFVENIKISDNLVSDYLTSGVYAGGQSTGSPRRVSIIDNDFWQPGNLQVAGTRGVVRVNEYTGKAASYIMVRGNNSDDNDQFFLAYVRGTTARIFQVKENFHPNITGADIILVLDADNANADISGLNDYTV